MFSRDTYVQRRARLAEQLDGGLLVFLGNSDSPMNYRDNIYHFRQDSAFLYYFGLDIPDLAAIVDLDAGRTTLFGNDPDIDAIVWTGPLPSVATLAEQVGVSEARPKNALAEMLADARRAGRKIHLLPQYRGDNKLLLGRLLDVHPDTLKSLESEAFTRAVIAQRAVKSLEEIAEIENALDITYEMHTLAMRMSKPGVVEQEIVGAMEGIAHAAGRQQSYPIIFSRRGEILHNHWHHNVLEKGDMIVNDSGATSPRHYASDITRTIPVGGKFTARQAPIYDLVLRAQEAAIAALKPGVPFADLHNLSCRILVDGMKDLGFFKGDTDEILDSGAYAMVFQCGLGHMMGLDVHDMEGLNEDWVGYGEGYARSPQFGRKYLRLARPVQSGWVVTVEPGVYLIPALIDRWQAESRHAHLINYARFNEYRDFGGVRIEDDVLVTDSGSRVLGKPIPKQRADVEALASA